MDQDYKKFGLNVIKFLDNIFLYGTGGLSISLFKLIKMKITKNGIPLDWGGKNWPKYYYNEKELLWILDRNKEKIYIPQSILIGPWESIDLFNEIRVELHEPNFKPPYKNERCLNFYIKKGDFPGENARLKNYDRDQKTLIFQGANYFDWIMTNLSLDFDRSPLSTLREETSVGQKLQSLDDSILTNITGINCLLFTNDGYMIYQKRKKHLLVRPNQLCSGFSGTIDKIDIANLMNSHSPLLKNMDSAREGVEEIGLLRSHIEQLVFLGITRELIRGGTPELFFSADMNISRKRTLELIPSDKEGLVKSINFGMYAKSKKGVPTPNLPKSTLWALLDKIETETKAPISIPFLTNIALWYWQWAEDKVGASQLEQTT